MEEKQIQQTIDKKSHVMPILRVCTPPLHCRVTILQRIQGSL